MSNVLRDDQLSVASAEELRAHYLEIADDYLEQIRQAEAMRMDPEAAVRAFANFAGCRPSQVTYIPAVETNDTSYLFEPLTPDELKRVSSWSLGSF